MIGIFASGATASLVAKIGTKKNFLNIGFLIRILRYLEAEIDYRPLMIFYRMMSQDYAQKFSSQSNKNLGHGSGFCHDGIISFRITLEAQGT